MYKSIAVTGGAGFVGSTLAIALKRDFPAADVVAFDNLKRRGSELSLTRLQTNGIRFLHGDIRCPEDVAALGACEVMIECSAEPSVHAGYGDDPSYLLNTNLGGTINALEHARRQGSTLIFLSSSRVYPIAPLRALPLRVTGERLTLAPDHKGEGWSAAGISESFPLAGHRSLYGATKLASELLIEEYRVMYGIKAVINRCGVLTGPWQMGKVDQGVVVLWMARHVFGGVLNYMGFGGTGHQVRDILHVEDLYAVIRLQMAAMDRHSGRIYNVGGGPDVSVSLRELTDWCVRISGRLTVVGTDHNTLYADVPYYVTDTTMVTKATAWTPKRSVENILLDIHAWLVNHRESVERIF